MKKIIVFIGLFIFSQTIIPQSIIGILQMDTPEQSSGYPESYRFYKNGSFEYHVNEEDGLSRIRIIGGNYSIKKDSIIFIAYYTVEEMGGHVEMSEIYARNNTWSIENCEEKKILIEKPKNEICPFRKIFKINNYD
ncbi:MAG: hypothetical protein P4L27_06325 [Ignavibacteriaceae bacterium]|nr:hypothetical protein [Ignavibacteriaceae bacterium]